MGYDIPSVSNDSVVGNALEIAGDGCDEINAILKDIQIDNILGNDVAITTEASDATNHTGVETQYSNDNLTGGDKIDKGGEVLYQYGITGEANITQASGAMVIDDLMQKISTKVQVAAQLLSTANKINQTASRIMSQG